MSDRALLTVGTRLQLLHEIEQVQYSAQVKEVKRDSFTTTEAVAGNKELQMEPGSVFQATLMGSDAVYYFTARVIDIFRENDKPYFIFQWPEQMHRHQRRSHVRVPCHLHVFFWSLHEALEELSKMIVGGETIPLEDARWGMGLLEELNAKLPARQGVTLDLSGGGLRMVAPEPVKRQERLLLKICLDERCRQFFLLEGRIVRSTPLAIGKWKRHRVGVAFMNTSQGIQERIIRHIFRIMRKRV